MCPPGTDELVSNVWGSQGDDRHNQHGQRNGCSDRNSANHEQIRAEQNKLKILTLNVCGLASKLLSPEFLSLIQQYDIIGLQETKTDDTDSYLEIPGYTIFFHNRACISRYRSGGIALLVKDNTLPYVKIDHTKSSKLVLFFTISKALYKFENHDEDLECGIVYIPPQGTKYLSDDPYLEMQEEIFRYCLDSKKCIIVGWF